MKNERINFRVSQEEKNRIMENAKRAGMKVSTYAAYATLEKEIIIIEGLEEVVYQLNKIGNNLNQLTKKSNQGMITCINLNQTKQEFGQLYVCLIEIRKKCTLNRK